MGAEIMEQFGVRREGEGERHCARTPVAFRIARRSSLVARRSSLVARRSSHVARRTSLRRSSRGAGATGVWYIHERRPQRRRDREAFCLAASASLRSCLMNIPDANGSGDATARTTTCGPCETLARGWPHFFVFRARANSRGLHPCPARRNGRLRPYLVKCEKSCSGSGRFRRLYRGLLRSGPSLHEFAAGALESCLSGHLVSDAG